MSTAGKVLTVLVTLTALVWVILTAAVTQANRNHAKELDDVKAKVAKLETDVAKSAHDLVVLKDDIHKEQFQTQQDLTSLQVRQADAEKARAQVKEIASRVQLQLADAEAILKNGTAHAEQRTAEKDAEIKAKADAEASVEKLKAENAALLARLTALRDKFKATLRENKSLVDRLLKAGGTPNPRRASLSR